MTATRLISLAVLAPSAISRSTTCGETCWPNRLVNAVARRRSQNAGLELAAQLHPDGAGQHPADQNDEASNEMKSYLRRRIVGELRRMIEYRHREQLGRRDQAGKGREPEIQVAAWKE